MTHSLEDIKIKHHFADGVYAKEQRIPRGYTVLSHSHVRDHLSILAVGRAAITYGNGEAGQNLSPGDCVVVKKGMKHTIEAFEDCVWYCIWPTEETDPVKVDASVIERSA
jgi:mannose-6-phosphate isomerase-like protein (cupin superfamily)